MFPKVVVGFLWIPLEFHVHRLASYIVIGKSHSFRLMRRERSERRIPRALRAEQVIE